MCKRSVLLGCTISLGLQMMGSFISRTLVMAFGYAYPAYESYKMVEKSPLEIFQLLFWCHYWILVALLTVFERVGDPLISWLPLYNEAKVAFFVYLWHPKTRGAACVFGLVLRPFIAKHEAGIDHYLYELRLKAADIAALFWHKTTSRGQTTLLDLLRNLSSPPASQTRRNQNLKKDEHGRTELAAAEATTEPESTTENGVVDRAEKKDGCEEQAPKLKRRKWRIRRVLHHIVGCRLRLICNTNM